METALNSVVVLILSDLNSQIVFAELAARYQLWEPEPDRV